MRLRESQGFNKEKLLFLVATIGFAGALYYALCTEPAPLEVGEPITAMGPPAPASSFIPEAQLAENFYVVDGKFTKLIDPRTGREVNRNRLSPFTLTDSKVAGGPKPPKRDDRTPKADIPLPPPPAADNNKTAPKIKDGKGIVVAPDVVFMGSITLRGTTCGFVKPKDGGALQQVKVGELIADSNYTVTGIDAQAIYVEDSTHTPYVIKDSRLDPASETAAADASGDTAAASDTAPAPAPKPAPAPAPKPNAAKGQGGGGHHGGGQGGGGGGHGGEGGGRPGRGAGRGGPPAQGN